MRIYVGWVLRTHHAGSDQKKGGCKAPTLRRAGVAVLIAAAAIVLYASPAHSQDSLSCFRADPIRFFSGSRGMIWIGSARYFMTPYSDTLVFSADSLGHILSVRRVLVDLDDTVVVSRGKGTISRGAGDSTYTVHWSERLYPDVTGTMLWQDNQWVVAFDGTWSQWSIRVRSQTTKSIIAAAARAMGSLPPVELTSMIYRAAAPTK